MGQNASNGNYVVEIAPPKFSAGGGGGWQPVPTQESPKRITTVQPQPWRITVNPTQDAVQLALVKRLKEERERRMKLASHLDSSQRHLPPSQQSHASLTFDDSEEEEVLTATATSSTSTSPRSTMTNGTCSSTSTDSSNNNNNNINNNNIKLTLSNIDNKLNNNNCVQGMDNDSHLNKLQMFNGMQGFSGKELRRRVTVTVDKLYGSSKLIDAEEAKCLVVALELRLDDETMLKALTAISQLAAFTTNQELLRENGCITQLQHMLIDETLPTSTRVMLTQSLGNMANNYTNMRVLQESVPVLCERLSSLNTTELEKMICAQTLVNLSLNIEPDQAIYYSKIVGPLYNRIWTSGKANITCLRLLINMSCCQDVIFYLLAAKCAPGVHGLLDHHQPEDILVRSATLLLNLVTQIDGLEINWSRLVCSRTDPSLAEIQSVYHLLTGPIGLTELSRRCKLLRYHPNEEIAQRCAKLVDFCQNRLQQS